MLDTRRINMRKIRDVLRLKLEARLSQEQTAAALDISKGVITKYLTLATAAGLAGGLGFKYTANTPPASFSDISACPDAKQANGWAGAISVTAVPGVGASYVAMTMGHLVSSLSLSGPLYGVDISAGAFAGRSVVTSVEIKTCGDCEAK